ncbi:MAG: ABC transporter ATP-binding protein [Pseudomonadota bacterium]
MDSSGSHAAITLAHVSVRHGDRRVLSVPALRFGATGMTAILGQNGSGKSTLMRIAAGQLKPSEGTARLGDDPILSFSTRRLAQRLAYLPQHLEPVQGMRVRELATLGRYAWRGALGRHTEADRAAVDTALAQCGCTDMADAPVSHLSGGECQRAWIAMLLAQQAPTLLLDEPISALDISHQLAVLDILRSHSVSVGQSCIVVLHDINLACHYADRIIVLDRGEIAFDGEPRALLESNTLPRLFNAPFALLHHPGRSLPVVSPLPDTTACAS